MTETTVPSTESPFRWRVANRPDTRFGHAAGGVAGLLIVAAIISFIAAIDNDDPQIAGIAFSIGLIVVAVAVGFWVRGPVRSAAVTCLVLALPLLWLFAVLGDADGVEQSDIRTVLLLIVVSYVALYAFDLDPRPRSLSGRRTPHRFELVDLRDRRSEHSVWLRRARAAATRHRGKPVRCRRQQPNGGNRRRRDRGGVARRGVILDRRRASGTATPFLVVGSIYAISGAITLGTDIDDVYATGAFVVLAGLAIGMAGTLGHRRATSWLGAIVLLSGAATVVIQGTDDSVSGNGSEEVFGAFALIAAAVLLVIGVLTARISNEPIDGGEPIPVKTPKPEPEPTPEPALVAAAPAAALAEPETAPVAETAPVTETTPATETAPATETTSATETAPASESAPEERPRRNLLRSPQPKRRPR